MDSFENMSRLKKAYLYFYVFAALYIEFGCRANALISGTVRMSVLLVLSFALFSYKSRITVKSTQFFLVVFLFMVILINAIRDGDVKNCALLFVPIFVGFCVAVTIEFKVLAKAFADVMVFVAAFSLVLFMISMVSRGAMSFLPKFSNAKDTVITDAFFFVSNLNAENLRNYGFTWEPGAFALLLSAAVFCEIGVLENTKLVRVIVLSVALLTTYSTMGYIVLPLIILSLSRQRTGGKRNILRIAAVMILLFALVVALMPNTETDRVFSKLEGVMSSGGEVDNDSTQARINAIVYPVNAFFSSPIIGIGYNRFMRLALNECNGVATNTVLNWFASMGIMLGLPCLIYYIRFVISTAKSRNVGTVALVVLIITSILLVSTESLFRISFIYVLVFYGCKNELLGKGIKSNEHSLHSRRI